MVGGRDLRESLRQGGRDLAYLAPELSSPLAWNVRRRLGVQSPRQQCRVIVARAGSLICVCVDIRPPTLSPSLRLRIPRIRSVQMNLIPVLIPEKRKRGELIIDKFIWPETHVVPFHYRKFNPFPSIQASPVLHPCFLACRIGLFMRLAIPWLIRREAHPVTGKYLTAEEMNAPKRYRCPALHCRIS
jgi:hypothetical protein